MTVTVRVDVLVSGLGPAGACAAAAAADAGLRVLAVERNAEPGLPVQCAEFVPTMIGAEVRDIGSSRIQGLDRMETFVGNEGADQTPDFLGHMIDRAEFDRQLVARAMDAGADCRFATPLRAISATGVATIGADVEVGAKVVIGADGPRSPVGAAIGCSNVELVETRQITVDLLKPHSGTDIFLRPEIVGGYAWLFPKGALCNIGLGVVAAEKRRLKPLLDALHAELVAEGRVGAAIHRHTGGLIPVGGTVGPTGAFGAVPALLCGDAAGLTNPITGAGINAAVISGRLAGEAAAAWIAGRADALDDYSEDMEDLFGPSLALALKRRSRLLDTYSRHGRPEETDLRGGWIAYPQYWRDEGPAVSAGERNGGIEAREMA
jgi:geranylgeranyl reductase family protein